MAAVEQLRIRLFSDGADLAVIEEMYAHPWVQGFTTNPTLMYQAGVRNYESFARALLHKVPDRPVCLEVFSDDETEMELQALTVAGWGHNVHVKIPVTNCAGDFHGSLLRRLSCSGVRLNITAVLTLDQVDRIVEALAPESSAIVSVFAGRIADTGIDPVPVMKEARRRLRRRPGVQLLWASPRELLNVLHAEEAGCDIITLPPELLRKINLLGRDPGAYSRETVAMFHRDARAAGYHIDTSRIAAAQRSARQDLQPPHWPRIISAASSRLRATPSAKAAADS